MIIKMFICSLCWQANLAIQEAKLTTAMEGLKSAQAQLDEKQLELDAVQAEYDEAIRNKQVNILAIRNKQVNILFFCFVYLCNTFGCE